MSKSDDCSSSLHEYCNRCDCDCHRDTEISVDDIEVWTGRKWKRAESRMELIQYINIRYRPQRKDAPKILAENKT